MSDPAHHYRRSVAFIVTSLLHGGIIFVWIHVKPGDRSFKTAYQPLTIFLVQPQSDVAEIQRTVMIARPSQPVIEHRSRNRQEPLLDSATPLSGVSVPPVAGPTSEAPASPANIDWTAEAQRSAEAIASRTAPDKSVSSAAPAGSAPWNPHPGGLESTPDGLKLRLIDPCFALLHNWTHDPLLGAQGQLQLNCNWKKPLPRGDLFDSIRRPSSP